MQQSGVQRAFYAQFWQGTSPCGRTRIISHFPLQTALKLRLAFFRMGSTCVTKRCRCAKDCSSLKETGVAWTNRMGKYEPKYTLPKKKFDSLKPLLDELSIADEAYLIFSHTNILYPFLFPATRKFEVEIVSMVAKMLYAKTVAGNATFLAAKCYKNMAKEPRAVTRHNLMAPQSVHPTFCKAAAYLGIELRVTRLTGFDCKWTGVYVFRKAC